MLHPNIKDNRNKQMIIIKSKYYQRLSLLLGLILFHFIPLKVEAQTSKVKIDRDSIFIGEQIIYTLEVETSPDDIVTFPEGQTFVPLEAVEASEIDTLQIEPKLKLLREYYLTQFDSGHYTIPPQFIQLKDGNIITDSLRLYVRDVEVDTLAQGLYPIKTYIDVKRPFRFPTWIWKLLIGLAIALGIAYLIWRYLQHRKEIKENLPPYEKALKALEELDKAPYMENRNLREYYSIMTDISRRYLEEKVQVRAMEYTTNELISDLLNRKSQDKILIKETTLEDFKKILERADLAKFARVQPDVLTAKKDRQFIKDFTDEVDQGIPEPTEEELKQNQAYQEKIAKRKQFIKLASIAGVIVLLLAGGVTYLGTSKGWDYVKDTYLGNPSKDLLEGKWITSSYGYPPVSITTPDVLVRGNIEMTSEAEQMLKGNETFILGGIFSNFYMVLSTLEFNEQQAFDLETAVDGVYDQLEKKEAYNILTKQEEYTSLDGRKGVKVFGSFAIQNPFTKKDIRKEYQILNFGEGGGFQQITMIYNADDNYADEIVKRILNSIELNKQEE